jgi:hypothetical protein
VWASGEMRRVTCDLHGRAVSYAPAVAVVRSNGDSLRNGEVRQAALLITKTKPNTSMWFTRSCSWCFCEGGGWGGGGGYAALAGRARTVTNACMRARVCVIYVSNCSERAAADRAHLRQLLIHIINREVSKA